MLDIKTIWTERKRISKERLELCDKCEFLERNLMRCAKCGCFLEAKTMIPGSKCPLNKWSENTREDLEK